MKTITVNKLQSEISKVIREAEAGEIFEVNRYSKSVAVVISKEKFEELTGGEGCKACMKDLRKIASKITNNQETNTRKGTITKLQSPNKGQ